MLPGRSDVAKRRFIVSLATVIAIVVTACGGGDSAADAVKARIEQTSDGEHAAVWESLHPAHQAIVSQQQFVDCGVQSDSVRSPVVDAIDVLGEDETTAMIPEIGEVEVTVVEVDLRRGEEHAVRRYTVLKEDGEWTWVLSEEALNAYRNGDCPA
jgi:hypothetical protein